VKKIKDEDKTKAEIIKELKTLRKKEGESALNDFVEYKQNEEKYQSFTKNILDSSAVGMFILDSDFKVVWINHSTEKYFGLQREKVIGKDKRKLVKKNIQHIFEDPDEFIRKVFATYDNNTYVENFECHVLPEGKRKERWLEHWSQPIKSGLYTEGRIEHYYDITKRKQAEQALIKSEEKYRTVFENTGTATIIIEEDKTISMVNTQSEKMYGYSKEEIENKMKWTDFVIPEDLERMKKYHIARRKSGGKAPTEYEFRLIDKKGNIKDIFLKIGMIPGTKKSVASLIDITERKQAEEKIKHLNLVLRAIRSVNQLITKEKNRERLLKGACNNLIETRGYHSAWIALLNEGGKLETYAEAGLGNEFLPIVEILKEGKLIFCGQKALKQQGVVTIKDPASTCPECPLIKLHPDQRAMTIRLEHDKKVYGFMSVSIPTHLADNQEEQSLFKEVAGDIAFSIHNIELDEERKQAEKKLKKTMDAAIDTMSRIIEAKDPYTSGHQHRVCQLATRIAQEMKLSKDMIEGIRIASLIHDIGKIGLPAEILSKPTKLTDIEFNLIKGHSQIGYDILKSIDFSYPIAEIVLQHHERLDGSGYPNNLKAGKILLEAKIIGVADVVEAMSSHRPYRPARGTDKALEEISQNRGILYDPEVVDACLKLFKEKGFKFE